VEVIKNLVHCETGEVDRATHGASVEIAYKGEALTLGLESTGKP